jgi:hypothetical protein
LPDLLKYAGLTGAGTVVIILAFFVVQRLIVGGVEEKFKSFLRSSEAEINSSLRSSEEKVRSELSRAEATLTRRLDKSMQVDLDLRSKRDSTYSKLWQLGQQLSRHPHNPHYTYEDAWKLAMDLRAWYYSDLGGMYLSHEARSAFTELLEELVEVAERRGPEEMWSTAQCDYERLHAAFDALRTELTQDLQTRVRSPLDEV